MSKVCILPIYLNWIKVRTTCRTVRLPHFFLSTGSAARCTSISSPAKYKLTYYRIRFVEYKTGKSGQRVDNVKAGLVLESNSSSSAYLKLKTANL